MHLSRGEIKISELVVQHFHIKNEIHMYVQATKYRLSDNTDFAWVKCLYMHSPLQLHNITISSKTHANDLKF